MPSLASAALPEANQIAQAQVIDKKLLEQLAAEDCIDEATARGIYANSSFDSPIPGWRLVLAELIGESMWAELVGGLFGLAGADITDFAIDQELFALIPEEVARRYQLVPLTRAGDEIYIGITDPREIDAYDHLGRSLGTTIRLIVLPPPQISAAIRRYYMSNDTSELEHIDSEEMVKLTELDIQRLREGGESNKIVTIVDRLFAHAINHDASDIHLEPFRNQFRVRFRIDGMLRPGPTFPAALAPWIVSRIKVLAKLDISERQVPQDGRVRTEMAGTHVDMRISSLPVALGEKLVVRLLGHSRLQHSLDKLGMTPNVLREFRNQLDKSQGLILVTGPTGSGKSTTLYSALMEKTSDEINVVTVEDPIEYEIPGLNQVPINPKRGVTFPKALRAILRQDPDVVLLGEIRDQETGQIATEAAVTGHLVFSTLHTNDAASSVQRLRELGVPKHLVAPALKAVLAQRLVRAVCKLCQEAYTPSSAELDSLLPSTKLDSIQLVVGRGCSHCEHTGYSGRIPVHELLVLDEELRGMIAEDVSTRTLRKVALAKGMQDLRSRALELVFSGQTTAQEFHRVVNF